MRNTKMKPSELLLKAKKHLCVCEQDRSKWRTESNYICNAVKIADGGEPGMCPATTTQGRKVIAHINHLLDGYSTLSEWLSEKHGIVAFAFSDNATQLQETRLAWMDDMIAYWEAKGE